MSTEGFKTCNHCGAVWDDNHQENGCPVRATTNRILAGEPDNSDRTELIHTALRERVRGALTEYRDALQDAANATVAEPNDTHYDFVVSATQVDSAMRVLWMS